MCYLVHVYADTVATLSENSLTIQQEILKGLFDKLNVDQKQEIIDLCMYTLRGACGCLKFN